MLVLKKWITDILVDLVMELCGAPPADRTDGDGPTELLLIYSLIDLVYKHSSTAHAGDTSAAHIATELCRAHLEHFSWCNTTLGADDQQNETPPFPRYIVLTKNHKLQLV